MPCWLRKASSSLRRRSGSDCTHGGPSWLSKGLCRLQRNPPTTAHHVSTAHGAAYTFPRACRALARRTCHRQANQQSTCTQLNPPADAAFPPATHRLALQLVQCAPFKLGLIQLQHKPPPVILLPDVTEASQPHQAAHTQGAAPRQEHRGRRQSNDWCSGRQRATQQRAGGMPKGQETEASCHAGR